MSEEKKSVEQNASSGVENKTYKFRSSSGTFISFTGRGRIYTTVTNDNEKMNIDVSPTKKNMIPVIYFEDITAVMSNLQLPGYWIFFIIVALIACTQSWGYGIFVLLFIWVGLNRKITICIRSGNKAVLYVNNKKKAKEFIQDIKSRAKIS